MRRDIKTRAGIAALIYTMINAVLFGAALITVLAVPYFSAHAEIGIGAAVAVSLLAAVPAAWLIAPRLRARTWHQPRRIPAPAYARARPRR